MDVLPSYTLTVQKSGQGTGTVAGYGIDCGDICSQKIPMGKTVPLTAIPDSESVFYHWAGCDSSWWTCTVTVNQDRVVNAEFRLRQYILYIAKSGIGSGSVSFPPNAVCRSDYCYFDSGTTVTLIATPDSGSAFVSWTGCDGTNGNTCTVNMNQRKNVSANFGYMLSVQKAGTGSGTVTGDGIDCGNDCTETIEITTKTMNITATPDNGSVFVSWTGCDHTNGNTCSFASGWNSNRTVTATFGRELFVQEAGSGWGTVEISPQGSACGDGTNNCYYSGTTVTLTANPSISSSFTSWSGCDSINGNVCTVFIGNQNKTITATFTLEYRTLSIQKTGTGSGTVTGTGINCGSDCSESFIKGTSVMLTATPNSGSTLTNWSGCNSTNGNTCTVSVDSNKTVIATFTLDVPQYTLQIQKQGTGGGTVTGGGIDCGSNCSLNLAGGTAVTLTATPDSSSSFTSWSGCDSTMGNDCTVTMNQSKTVTATFNLQYYTLSLQKGGCGTGTVTGPGINCGSDCSESFLKGTSVTAPTATPNSGSVFARYYVGTYNAFSTSWPLNDNLTVTALFGLQQFMHSAVGERERVFKWAYIQ